MTMGDTTDGDCDLDNRSYVMSMSRVHFPAAPGMSNLTFIVDNDVHLASGTSAMTPLNGFAIYASGEVHMAAQRKLIACGNNNDGMSPFGSVIRIVMPPSSGT